MDDLLGRMQQMQQEMQQRMADAQEQLANQHVTAEAGGGMVKVTADGRGRLVAVKLDPTVVDASEMEMLEDLLIAGVNKALEEAEALKAERLRQTAGAMLPPGLDLGQLGL